MNTERRLIIDPQELLNELPERLDDNGYQSALRRSARAKLRLAGGCTLAAFGVTAAANVCNSYNNAACVAALAFSAAAFFHYGNAAGRAAEAHDLEVPGTCGFIMGPDGPHDPVIVSPPNQG